MSKSLKSSFRDLNPKERVYVQCRLDGMTQIASAQAAGWPNAKKMAYEVEKRPHVQTAIMAVADEIAEEVGFDRKEAHDLLMQAYLNADTAGEQVAAVRAMIDLHGIAKPKVVEHKHDHKHSGQIEYMPTKELMKLAEMEDLALEGEYEVIEDAELLEGPEEEDVVEEAL